MSDRRCPICGRPHAPGACPTSGAGSGAPRSILGAAAVPRATPHSRVEIGPQMLGDGAALFFERVPAPNLNVGLGATINSRIAARYDELMREGRHGHYETMFRVVAEELATMTAEPAAPKPESVGPAPWMAPRGECRSCDRRRDSVKLAKKKVPKP